MNIHADKTQENKSQAVANRLPKQPISSESTFQFVDNRPEAIAQGKLQEAINNSSRVQQLKAFQEMANSSRQAKQAVQLHAMANNFTSQIKQRKENLEEEPLQGKFETAQRIEEEDSVQGKSDTAQFQEKVSVKPNNTGLPNQLNAGIESLSGMSMDHVKVNYNSDQPAQPAQLTPSGTSGEVLQKEDGDDDDGYSDSEEDRETWKEWSKSMKYPPGYTCWTGWHINWTLGDGDQYHVTEESQKAHYFFKLEGGKPVSCNGGMGKGKNSHPYSDLPRRVRRFIESNWKKMSKD